MCFGDDRVGGRLINTGDDHLERDTQPKAATFPSRHPDRSNNADVVILDLLFFVAGDVNDRIAKTGSVACGEQLLRIRRVAFAANAFG